MESLNLQLVNGSGQLDLLEFACPNTGAHFSVKIDSCEITEDGMFSFAVDDADPGTADSKEFDNAIKTVMMNVLTAALKGLGLGEP